MFRDSKFLDEKKKTPVWLFERSLLAGTFPEVFFKASPSALGKRLDDFEFQKSKGGRVNVFSTATDAETEVMLEIFTVSQEPVGNCFYWVNRYRWNMDIDNSPRSFSCLISLWHFHFLPSPDLICQLFISRVGTTASQLGVPSEWAPPDLKPARKSARRYARRNGRIRQIECQAECQKICQIECQKGTSNNMSLWGSLYN